MLTSNLLVLTIALLAGLLLVALIVILFVNSRSRRMDAGVPAVPSAVEQAVIAPGERASSLVSEQIEQMVIDRLRQYPDLAGIKLDFGTMPDGTIDIWVGDVQYDDPADIPDERIRQAIREAVAEFNAR